MQNSIRIGRIGREILNDISDPHLRAELLSDPEGVICGGCQQELRHGHLPHCPEFPRALVIEPRCDSCRHPRGHEQDCPRLTELVNDASDGGAW